MCVMPICTVDRKRLGSAANASARLAPLRPAAASAFSRALRAETTASSDIANRPFKQTSEIMIARSNQGKRSEEHTSELQSLMRISYAVFCLKKKKKKKD